MKRIFLCWFILLMSVAGMTVEGQTAAPVMYFVDDPDGYVNVRYEPGTDSDISNGIRNKSVVQLDPEGKIENGWVPVLFWGFHSRGYIFQDRLKPVSSIAATLISKYIEQGEKLVYIMSPNHSDLFLFADYNWETMTLRDLKKDEVIFDAGVPVCMSPIWGDTISFHFLYDLGWDDPKVSLKPMFAVYKLYEQNGNYDFYTEISPQPVLVSSSEAKKIVEEIKKRNSNIENMYFSPNLHTIMTDLFTAYCSGEQEALDILKKMSCDGGICHEQDLYLNMMDAWRRSLLKPGNNK